MLVTLDLLSISGVNNSLVYLSSLICLLICSLQIECSLTRVRTLSLLICAIKNLRMNFYLAIEKQRSLFQIGQVSQFLFKSLDML